MLPNDKRNYSNINIYFAYNPTMLEIAGLIETSFVDWDGKVVATLFVPRCNFRCPFCQNHDLILHPEKCIIIPQQKIQDFLLKHKDFIDGICMTGGEPTLYDLSNFFNKIKKMGFLVKLDTNGANPQSIKKLIDANQVDYIAMDLKAPLNEKYEKAAGIKVNIEDIKKSIDIIMKSNIEYEFRTTAVPTILKKEDIADITSAIKNARKYALQQFDPKNAMDPALRKISPYTGEEILEMAQLAGKNVKTVVIRGTAHSQTL